MTKLFSLILLALVLALAAPASAQDGVSPLVWIPADFSGFVRVDMASPLATLEGLNLSYYVASFIQPRAQLQNTLQFTNFFPLDVLDTETVTFEQHILPWVEDEVVLAYREFDERFGVSADDALLILPAADPFLAATFLSTVTRSQDFPQRDTYLDTTIYIGDRTSIAFTPAAVLIGTDDTLRAALDTGLGDGESLVNDATYKAIDAVTEDGGTVSAYLRGETATRALSVALQGDTSALPFLEALGGALEAYDVGALEKVLLSGDVDGLALRIEPDAMRGTLQAMATVHTAGEVALPDADESAFDGDVLEMIPRSAMIVQTGADSRAAFYDTILSLPLTGFVFNLVGGFLIDTRTTEIPAPPMIPAAEDIEDALAGFETALSTIRDFDLTADLVDHLEGSYAVALLPRPNNPAQLTNAPYDLLLVAQVSDVEAALAGATELAETVLAMEPGEFAQESVEGIEFNTVFVTPIREPMLQIGIVDDMLVVGTGTAVQEALLARAGDNRLLDMERWQRVNPDNESALYVDLNAVYSTLFANQGGTTSAGIGQLNAAAHYLGDGVFQVDVTVTLPTLF